MDAAVITHTHTRARERNTQTRNKNEFNRKKKKVKKYACDKEAISIISKSPDFVFASFIS